MKTNDARVLIANYCHRDIAGRPLHTIYDVYCKNGITFKVCPEKELEERFDNGRLNPTKWIIYGMRTHEGCFLRESHTAFREAQMRMMFLAAKYDIVHIYFTEKAGF